MNIYGNRVILRAIEKKDCKMICEMFNDPEMEKSVVGWAFPISEFAQERWLDNHYNDQSNLRFVIETKEDGAVGIATLTGIDWKNRHATHGIKLASNAQRGKGIGTDTVMAIMKYAFDELGLHRLESTRFATNTASKKLFEKCGWLEEGIKKECVYKNGEYKDLVLIRILDSEYYDLIANINYWDSKASIE